MQNYKKQKPCLQYVIEDFLSSKKTLVKKNDPFIELNFIYSYKKRGAMLLKQEFILLLLLTTSLTHAKQSVDYNGNYINPSGEIIITPATSSATLARYTQTINVAGLLDQTFGSLGIADPNFLPLNNSQLQALVIQPDGKLVAAGYTSNGVNNRFIISRYNTNGSLDISFGTAGFTVTDVTPGNNSIANALIIQPDGKLVAAGYGGNGVNDVFAIVRYTTNGILDTSFGTNGITSTDVSPGIQNQIKALVIQPDGKLVAAGFANNGVNQLFALARYSANGVLDTTTFGTGGITTTDATPVNGSQINALIIQPDGKLVAAGYGSNGVYQLFTLARYSTNGILDTATFGTAGITVTDVTPPNTSLANALIIQPDGKLVAAGYGGNGVNNFSTLTRYNNNGILDTTFGTAGITVTNVTPLNNNQINACLIQPDGKLIAAGYGSNGVNNFFALTRYSANGILDTTFGTAGITTTDVTSPNNNQINACLIQPDGKIVAAGYGSNGVQLFALTRYTNPFTLASFTASYGEVGLL